VGAEVIKPMGPEWAKHVADHQTMYPVGMREDEETFLEILSAEPMFSLIDIKHGVGTQVRGWIVVQPERRGLYVYDLAVMPECQRKGIGKRLFSTFLQTARWHGLHPVRYHTRVTSYPLLSNVELLAVHGYRIVSDQWLPEHYHKEYGGDVHEDAHEVRIEPVGYRRR
jgi:ribosomal protein S18 acetylase RimI-like enzyme